MRASTSSTITADAARFVIGLRFGDIPQDALGIGRRCIIDGLGLYVAGLSEDCVTILVEEAKEQGGRQEALLLGGCGAKVPAAMAARVLGTAGHAHDWDDTQVSNDPDHIYGLLTHPTVPTLSAALALCGAERAISGEDFLTAFHAGFEVECKLSEWMLPNLYKRSFHSSGVVGIFGACTTAAKLMQLDESKLRNAMGIAASMAAGLRANFGTMTKPLHVGRAAENGIIAARLASRGFTADPTVIDGPWGYARAYADGVSEEKLSQGFGKTWSIVDPGVSIKPYPSGILTHQSMDAILELVRSENLAASDIASVSFFAGSNILNPIRYPVASNHLQAKFSMAALLSMMILRRRAGPKEFTDEFVRSEIMQNMQRRIATQVDPRIEELGTDVIRSRIEVVLNDGRHFEKQADERYRGGPTNPFSDEDLRHKLAVCCDSALSPERQNLMLDAVSRLEGLAHAGILAELIQPDMQIATA